MLPLSDGLHPRRFPIVNVALIAANFAVWILYELPHLNSAIYHASFYPCTVDNACRGPGAVGDQLVHGDVHARQLGPHPRQHALPRDLRQERRGRVRAPPLPRLLHRRRLRRDDDADGGHAALRHGGRRTRSESRRERRDRRRPRRLLRPLPDRAHPDAGARLLRQDPGLGLPRRLVPLPARRSELRPRLRLGERRRRRLLRARRRLRLRRARHAAPPQRRARRARRARRGARPSRRSEMRRNPPKHLSDRDLTVRAAKATAAALAVGALAFGIWQVRSVLILLLLALTFAAAIRPGVDGSAATASPSRSRSSSTSSSSAEPSRCSSGSRCRRRSTRSGTRSARTRSPAHSGQATGVRDRVLAWLQQHLHQLPTGTQLLHPVATYGHKAGEAVVAVFFTLAATWYCVSERDAIIKLLTALAPEAKRDKARETYLAIDRRLGAYTRLRFLMVFAVGAVLSTGFYVIGLNYWLLVGAFVGLIEIVPMIGPLVGSILVLAVGLPQSLHVAALSLLWLVRRPRVPELRRQPPHRADGRALAARHAPLGRGRRRALRRTRGHPRGPVHLGGCDAHRRPRARSRPARRTTSPLAPAPSLRMTPGTLAGRGSATAARALRQPEVRRRQGRARRPRRAGARARHRRRSSCARTTTSQRSSTTPWRAARTRSASPAATARSPSSRQPLSHTSFRSSAFPPAPATTSRSTSASTATIWSARSTPSPTASSAGSTWRR